MIDDIDKSEFSVCLRMPGHIVDDLKRLSLVSHQGRYQTLIKDILAQYVILAKKPVKKVGFGDERRNDGV